MTASAIPTRPFFAAFCLAHADRLPPSEGTDDEDDGIEARLARLDGRTRMVFLLVAMERFPPHEVADMLDLSTVEVEARLEAAGRTLSVGLCKVRRVVGAGDGPREIGTDCSSRNGMSGAAYLTTGPEPALVGLHVGYRSTDPAVPRAYSNTHYTFGTSAEGSFRNAVSD